jgi:hypothetical protein
MRDLVTGEAALLEEDRPVKAASSPKPRKAAKPQVPYSEGLKKASFKDLLAETAREPEEQLASAGEPGGATANDARERRGSLLERLSSLEEPAQASPADAGETRAKEKAKVRWFGRSKPKG